MSFICDLLQIRNVSKLQKYKCHSGNKTPISLTPDSAHLAAILENYVKLY